MLDLNVLLEEAFAAAEDTEDYLAVAKVFVWLREDGHLDEPEQDSRPLEVGDLVEIVGPSITGQDHRVGSRLVIESKAESPPYFTVYVPGGGMYPGAVVYDAANLKLISS